MTAPSSKRESVPPMMRELCRTVEPNPDCSICKGKGKAWSPLEQCLISCPCLGVNDDD